MKNIFLYYFSILLPFPIMYYASLENSMMFVVLLLVYYIFRGFTDANRLIQKGCIPSNDFYKLFIPFYRSRYFKELYFQA